MKTCKVVLVLCVALLFMPWVPLAHAEESIRMQELEVDIRHTMSGQPGVNSVNLFGGDGNREVDTWPRQVANQDGLYWGPLIPCSMSRMPVGAVVDMRTTIQLRQQDIASGASGFWIRLPFDGTTVHSLRLGIDEWVDPDFPVTTNIVPGIAGEFPTNMYFRNQGNSDNIIWHQRGVFIRLDTALSTVYKFAQSSIALASPSVANMSVYPELSTEYFIIDAMDVTPRKNMGLVMLWSEEEYVHSFELFYRLPHSPIHFQKNVPATPAWAFIFQRGLPSTGTFSFDYSTSDAIGRSNMLFFEQYIPSSEGGGNYLTFSIPYRGESSWRVFLYVDRADNLPVIGTLATTIGSRKDLLVFSSSSALPAHTPGDGDFRVIIGLIPKENITLFSAFAPMKRFMQLENVNNPGLHIYQMWSMIFDNGYRGYSMGDAGVNFSESGFSGLRREQMFPIPIWSQLHITSGVYAEVTWEGSIQIIDFMWGVGAVHPGTMTILMEVGGYTIPWRGNVELLYGGIIPEGVLEGRRVEREYTDEMDIIRFTDDGVSYIEHRPSEYIGYSPDTESIRPYIAPHVDEDMVVAYYNNTHDIPENEVILLLRSGGMLNRIRDSTPTSTPADDDLSVLQIMMYAIKNLGVGIWEGIKGAVSTLWDLIAGALSWIGNFVIDLVGRIVHFLKQVVTFIGNMIMGMAYILPPTLMIMGFVFITSGSEGVTKPIKRTVRDVKRARVKPFEMEAEHYKKKQTRAEKRMEKLRQREKQMEEEK